jgi:CheY-like chemotaxis protein
MADVLVFDDDPSVGDLIAEVLRGKGLTVSHFLSGAGAVQLVQENKPRLVLLDIMMPGMDGLTACRTLKSNPTTKGVKIAILTAKDFNEDRATAQRHGADLYFNKPLDHAAFIKQVQRVLGLPEEERAQAPAPPVAATLLPGCAVVETAGLLVLFDAGKGLAAWLARQSEAPKTGWLLLSRYDRASVAELPAAARLVAAGMRLNVAGPDETDGMLQRCAPPLCATRQDGTRGTPLLYPQREGEFSLSTTVKAETRLTQHPGTCLAYRLVVQGRAIVYCPAHEVHPDLSKWNPHEHEKFRDLFEDADLLVHGYRRSLVGEGDPKDAWRGAWEPVVDLAAEAGVRHLALVPLLDTTPHDGIGFRAEERAQIKGSSLRVDVVRSDARLVL